MESLPKEIFLQYNENTLETVRKLFGLEKPGAMENAINVLEEWVKMQMHFEKTNFDRRYLETTIIVSKGSIERAKSRLDKGCTLRTLMPHLFGVYDIRKLYNTDLKDIKNFVLPKITKDNIRVTIVKIKKIESIDAFVNMIRALTYTAEYLRRYDYAETNCLIVDYTETDLAILFKMMANNIFTLQHLATYLLECCGFRLKTLYVISSSKLVEAIVVMLKQVISAKLRNRLHVLKDQQSLKRIFEEEILPKEYGGKEISSLELHEQWIDVLSTENHIQYMKEMSTARTDETRRHSAKFNEDYLGMPGSFRKLNVD